MTDLTDDPVFELKAVLAEHLGWHGVRIDFLHPVSIGVVGGA